MISINNVYKIYENNDKKFKALENINLEIKENEIFGVIGLSGAGKSTLIRTINRLEEPTKGHININGKNILNFNKKELRSLRKNIGMIFQNFNLLNSKTVFENIAFPLKLQKLDKKYIEKRVNELLDLVNLKDKKNTYPSQLSGGQKQRVAIARALANNPNILLCDEATSSLDPKTTKRILTLLKDIQNKLDLTIVLITHEMEVIKEICNRVAIMENGKIIELDTVTEVFTNPKTETSKSFINKSTKDLNYIKLSNLEKRKVYKLKFIGEVSKEPIIAEIIKKFNIYVNILSGNIDELMSNSVGTLIVEFLGNEDDINKAKNWIKDKNIRLELIKN
ncbi:MAG: ATP-binding cassette domain-containing protein [Firmicutes bacterium]|nr:ATP-binding cassette domain-containing protein [Bacillota bacterium]